MQSRLVYDRIYNAAKQQNEVAIREILASGASLTVYQRQDAAVLSSSPIAALAKEGEVAAVNFLLAQGADINEALCGYALGGHATEARTLIKKGGNKKCAIHNYAIGGHEAQVEPLLETWADLDEAVGGYALGNHEELVTALLDRGANINMAVYGYAACKQVEKVAALLKQGADKTMALVGYALGDHVAEVNALLRQGGDKDVAVFVYAVTGSVHYEGLMSKLQLASSLERNTQKMIIAVKGYARGGHVDQVEALLAKGADFVAAAEGYASGGHVAKVKDLLVRVGTANRGPLIIAASLGYAKGCYITQVNALLDEGADKNAALYGYANGGHVAQVKALLEEGADVNEAIRGYDDGHRTHEANNLLKIVQFQKQKKQHAIYTILVVVAAIILSPFSLFLTLPLLSRTKNRALIQKLETSKEELAQVKQKRQALRGQDEKKPAYFKPKKDAFSEKGTQVTYLVDKAQLARFKLFAQRDQQDLNQHKAEITAEVTALKDESAAILKQLRLGG